MFPSYTTPETKDASEGPKNGITKKRREMHDRGSDQCMVMKKVVNMRSLFVSSGSTFLFSKANDPRNGLESKFSESAVYRTSVKLTIGVDSL